MIIMVKCTGCNKTIKEGAGRYNFPSGIKCMKCGSPISDILNVTEKLLDIYGSKTGYRPRIGFR